MNLNLFIDHVFECMCSSPIHVEELIERIVTLVYKENVLLSCGVILTAASQKELIIYYEEDAIHRTFRTKDFKFYVMQRAMDILDCADDPEDSNTIIKISNLTHLLIIPIISSGLEQGYFWVEKDREASSFFENEIELAQKIAFMLGLILSGCDHEIHVQERRLPHEEASLCSGLVRNDGLIFTSPIMKDILKKTCHFSKYNVPVLITGETGTGKDEIAKIIHRYSMRSNKSFIIVNCGAIPESLFESELFGHKKGAFTTALYDKRGLMKEAHEGTLFFDEIGDLSINNQVKILRAIENSEFRPIGDTAMDKVDVRYLFATHKNLEAMMEQGLFREDLYFRISTAIIHLPPLRERKEEIPIFFTYFIEKFSIELGVTAVQIENTLMQFAHEYPWYGNCRELSNFAKQLVLWHHNEAFIDYRDLPLKYRNKYSDNIISFADSLHEAKEKFMRDYVLRIMDQCKHNKKKACKILRISRWGLVKLLKRLEIA